MGVGWQGACSVCRASTYCELAHPHSQMACSSAVPGHTYGNFSWGDKRSLWDGPRSRGIDVRARVLDHYLTHYGAERMTLVLLGGQSLDELEGWAKELFAATPG